MSDFGFLSDITVADRILQFFNQITLKTLPNSSEFRTAKISLDKAWQFYFSNDVFKTYEAAVCLAILGDEV